MKYFIFLKGVNVGGNLMVDMTLLKNGLKKAGIENISSYLNSGNLIVETGLEQKAVVALVEKSVEKLFSLKPAVFAKTGRQLAKAVSNNPFSDQKDINKGKLLVYFPSGTVDPDDFKLLSKNPAIDEEYHGNRDLLYVYYHNGAAHSKLTANYIDKTLKVVSTGRNLNTVEALLEK